jgi:hypothetical protein
MPDRDETLEGAKVRVILLDQPVEIRPQGGGSAAVGNTRGVHVEIHGLPLEAPFKPESGRGSASLNPSLG